MLPLFMALGVLYGCAPGGIPHASPWAALAAIRVRRALRLHRDDLRVPAVPAGMGEPAHAWSTSSLLGMRLRAHARRGARGAPGRRSRRRYAFAAIALRPSLARARRRARAQCAAAPQLDPADRHRHQASAHRAEVAGLHGRLVQHARVLPRPRRRSRCATSSGCSSSARSSCRPRCSLAGLPAVRRVRRAVSAGLLAERWYFFAQANHPQNLYYQAIS